LIVAFNSILEFMFLTTIGNREYHLFVKGSIDSELKAKERRGA